MKKLLFFLMCCCSAVVFAAPQNVEIPLRKQSLAAPCGLSVDFQISSALPAASFRWQILTSGADSAPAHLQLVIARRSKGTPSYIQLKIKYSKQEAFDIRVPFTVRPNIWYNAVVNFDGKNILLYINGKLLAEKSCAKGLPRTWKDCVIGGYGPTDSTMNLPGEVKNFKLSANALATVESKANTRAASAFWSMCDNTGQMIKGSGLALGFNGFLGDSAQADESDAQWAGSNGITLGGGKKAILPASSLFCLENTRELTVEFEVKPLTDSGSSYFRNQFFTINADSNPNHFQCFWEWNSKTRQKEINVSLNVNNKKVRFSGKADLPIQQFSKITIVLANDQAELYCNGMLIASGKAIMPLPVFGRPMNIGAYAFGKNLGFTGQIRNFTITPQAIHPRAPAQSGKSAAQAESSGGKIRLLLSNNATERGAAPLVFFARSGNWQFQNNKLCEFSDNNNTPSTLRTSVLKNFPHDYVFDVVLTMEDAMGCSRIYCGGDGVNDGYVLEHIATDNGDLVWLRLYRLQQGKKKLLAEKSAPDLPIPRGKRGQQLKFTVARSGRTIGAAINDKFFLAVQDSKAIPDEESLGVEAQGRKIIIEELKAVHYPDYVMPIKPEIVKDQELKIQHAYRRHAFYRNEKHLTLQIVRTNRLPETLAACTGRIMLKNLDKTWRNFDLPATGSGQSSTVKYDLQIDDLAPGEYTLQLQAGLLSAEYKLFIAAEPLKERTLFLDWGSGVEPVKLANFHKYKFNGSSVTVNPQQNFDELAGLFGQACDMAIKNNLSLGIHYSPVGQPPANPQWRVLRNDKSIGKLLDCNVDAAQQYAMERMEKFMQLIKNYPAFKKILFSSEIENSMEFSYRRETVDKFTAALKFPPPSPENSNMLIDNAPGRMMSVPAEIKNSTPAIVPADNQWYKFFDYFWKEGFGDNLLHEKLAEIVKKHVPDMITIHDPFRDVPLFGRNRGLDAYGTWFYCHPDGGEALTAIEMMLAAVRGKDGTKGFQFGPSLWLYSSEIGPAKTRQAGTQPRATFMTALWLGLAANPLWFEFYSVSFLMPDWEVEHRDNRLLGAMSDFHRRFAAPLLPAMHKMQRQKNESAFFIGMSNKIFSAPVTSGYGKAVGNAFLNLLWKAHVPADCIFEDSIRNGELKNYKQVFLYGATHLPEDVYKKLKEFQAAGGRIISSRALAKYFPGAEVYEPDLSPIRFSSYYYITRKKGYDAASIYALQQKTAGEIAEKFSLKKSPAAWSSNHELYLRTLENGSCKYIFAKNDRRTYGDFMGKKYHAVFDGELPLEADILLDISADSAVYDFSSQKLVKHHPATDGKRRIKMQFAPGEGKVLMVYEHPADKIQARLNNNILSFQIMDTAGKLLSGIQPVQIQVISPDGKESSFSSYAVAVNGAGTMPLNLGKNAQAGKWEIKVTSLFSGHSCRIIKNCSAY